ncbi:dehydratase [Lithospermum erythrorhizon]|uniref:4a-hydroxytetrahydrobiopterin dehydratase n=1 Tax=Lithospermum erythrorhizon TaxID=34254 RepID=A0AAV3P661_LITER
MTNLIVCQQGTIRSSLSQTIYTARFNGDVAHHGAWKNFAPAYRSTTRASRILQNCGAMSSNEQTPKPIRNFSTAAEDLSAKTCIPCTSKELRPMTEEEANEMMPKVPEWNLVNEGGVLKLQRTWKVKNFLKGLEFFQLVAEVAEAEGHHPDLHLLDWNKVQIEVLTHAQGGLTENDFIVAAKIGTLDASHLLSKRKAK